MFSLNILSILENDTTNMLLNFSFNTRSRKKIQLNSGPLDKKQKAEKPAVSTLF
jgi:hypothetical protein